MMGKDHEMDWIKPMLKHIAMLTAENELLKKKLFEKEILDEREYSKRFEEREFSEKVKETIKDVTAMSEEEYIQAFKSDE
ncbi:hypothetical protein [Alkalicoccobacillus porphyridii]|uniref:Uncharacterized protein n=1 Tax=Alkalicoccobacillus porphyridii TaxID=2597270 RepID=A0A553ZYL2_9BACI|nr:hypothetical protein [Alkalicoccobacillus porphyridii]TSB46537.1 hypothetical protein FN960_09230 [Alkalicoccobacillus porphyridii]